MSDSQVSAQHLAALLMAAQNREQAIQSEAETSEKIHTVTAGKAISSAYEQIRNAAEYGEDHLLLQRAIARFYQRIFISDDDETIYTSGEELVTELTLASYLPNDSIDVTIVKKLNVLVARYYQAYQDINGQFDGQVASSWVVSVLAFEAESLLRQHMVRDVFTQFAFDSFNQSLQADKIFETVPGDYELLLYVAIHRALLKSSDATIRAMILQRFMQTPDNVEAYKQTNQKIDELLESKQVDRLMRLVNRHGAGLRVLAHMAVDRDDMAELLGKEYSFMNAFEDQVMHEYETVSQKIKRGLMKSIAFLVITKFILGIAAEVPYDVIVYGSVLWLPLIVNLFAPIIYMVLLGFTLSMPGQANTEAVVKQMQQLLYSNETTKIGWPKRQRYTGLFNAIYSALFIVIFGVVTWGLWMLKFDIVHLVIFFIFFSAASFLGFRLSRMIREIEAVDSDQNAVSTVRDFVYMPFVVLGRKISEEYSKINVIAVVLDMVIELPLKSLMRLSRQWNSFISSKKDEL